LRGHEIDDREVLQLVRAALLEVQRKARSRELRRSVG
jgi:hypothetical protein